MRSKFLLKFNNLVECKILNRINRFTVEIEIEKKIDYALLTNTGRLKDIIFKGAKGLCMKKEKFKKLKYVLLGTIVDDKNATLIDTRYQLVCFEEAQKKKIIPWLKDAKLIKRNVKINNSLLDYLFKNYEEIYVEVKSAVLFDGYYSMYPDCPSLRGRKHVDEIIKLKEKGKKSMIVFISAHPLAKAFKPYYKGDPILSLKIKEAYKRGVEIHSIKFFLSREGEVYLVNPDLPLNLH